MSFTKDFSPATNKYKSIYARSYYAHLELKTPSPKHLFDGLSPQNSRVEINRAFNDCCDWLKTYAQMETRFEQQFEQKALAFFTLPKTKRDEQRAAFVEQTNEGIDALATVWQAALRRAKAMLSLHQLLELQHEILEYGQQRHIELMPFISQEERTQDVAFLSLFPLLGTTDTFEAEKWVTLREISPSPINIILLANGKDDNWRDERAQWVSEIMLGWAFSSGTWPHKGRVRLMDWNAELWGVFIRDDFRWVFLPRQQQCSETQRKRLLRKIARIMYRWQRGHALRASSFYRKPLTEEENALAQLSKREQARQERIERERLIEIAIAEQSPDILLGNFSEKEALQKALLPHQQIHQFTEREQMVILLKMAEPKIKVKQIADILGVTERIITSDLRIIKYHIHRPKEVVKQSRRKTAKFKAV